ncbi:MAG: TIGR01777 family oxidoreductase [Myxococcales bacterium]|nr:TIGR01777 family oxidoreductase [Myxococcales bacterium]
MRILLTGGTGFIGAALARVLAERGHQVARVSRDRRAGLTWDAIDGEVGRAEAIVHLAGEPIAGARFTATHLERVRESRVETTERIARAIERAAARPRVFVSASAAGYYGMRRDDAVLDEAAPPGDDPVAQICVAWEQAADPARAAGVRVVHPRFGTVLGRGGGALAKLEPAFRWFVGGPLGDGRQWVSWIHLADAVRAVLFAIDRESVSGPMNVVAPEPVRMNDLAAALGRAMRRPSRLRAPALALRVALGEGFARLLLTGQRATPARLLAEGFDFRFARLDLALADLYARAGTGS